MKIGAMTNCFQQSFRESLEICSQLGVDGVQIWATRITYYHPDHPIEELDPDSFTETVRQDLLGTLDRLGLEISALCGDLGRQFVKPDHIDEDVAKTKRMMDMAQALGVKVLTSHIGRVPADASAPGYRILQQAMEEIGAHGDRIGVCLATETGPESGADLAAFLDTLKTKSVKANYDPANLVMGGYDPVQGARDLAKYIAHTHAKDGIRPAEGKPLEVPLGEGQVAWPAYLQALRDGGFDGFLTIEREVGDDPAADITAAVGFLRKQLAALGA
jgi:sugar phosphate isomerase/epimerase